MLIIYGDLTFVVNLTNVTTLVTMALVNASAFLLVRREHLIPPGKTYFRIPLGILIPALGGISCVAMLVTLDPGIPQLTDNTFGKEELIRISDEFLE